MNSLIFIIDGQVVDVNEKIDFTRIYRGADTADAKKNNYSLTVKFPFSYTNDLIFKRTNSLSYKSDFPYDEHICDVLSSTGITLINKANLRLLSTTDSYECAMTWENFDIIGAVLNNPIKLGALLSEFPLLNWNFEDSLCDCTYDTTKADTYGLIEYDSGGRNYFYESSPDTFNQKYNLPHPVINYKYLLSEVCTALGITINIPTLKDDFLKSLIIRPNKRLNSYKNNVFKCCFNWYGTYDVDQVIFMVPNFKNVNYLLDDKNLGNNSFYFNVEVTTPQGDDDLRYLGSVQIYDPVQDDLVTIHPLQMYRVNCLNDCTATFTITDFPNILGSCKIYKLNWVDGDPPTGDYVLLDTFSYSDVVLGNAIYTHDIKKNDFLVFVFEYHDPSVYFELTIDVDVNSDLSATTTPMSFPSMFHIPSCIDLSSGELITEALKLTGSELTYDVNSDTYSFSEKTKQNDTAYDITDNVTRIKEITYDTKYLFNTRLGQNNFYKYLTNSPIDGDYNKTLANENLVLNFTQLISLFSTSAINTSGTFDDEAIVHENDASTHYTHYYIFGSTFYYNIFNEQPLHLFWNDVVNSRVVYLPAEQNWSVIFGLFYSDWFADLETRILSGTVRLIKLNAEITDIEFKRINTKGIVYIKTYGKFYSIIEIAKNGDFAEFFLLELY